MKITHIKNYILFFGKWYEANLAKIVFICMVHISIQYLTQLPYFNIYINSFTPFIFDWILIIFIFKPDKINVLKMGMFLFIIMIPFSIIQQTQIVEVLGVVSFLAIVTYLLMMRKNLIQKDDK